MAHFSETLRSGRFRSISLRCVIINYYQYHTCHLYARIHIHLTLFEHHESGTWIYLVDEDYMCKGFYLSCMLVWNLVVSELVALPKPMFVEVLQDSDG